jgi:flagellar export protein FliJ
MAELKGLIKVRRHNVEEKQKFLAELYRQVEAMNMRRKKLEDDIIRERKALEETSSAESIAYFGRYAEATRKKIEQLEHEISKMETRIDIAREDMRAAFAEQKKIEITQERREDEETEELRKRENKELDEVGIEGFRRKTEED